MQVCTNAVVPADKQGIASLMDRLARLVSRHAYGHQAMVALRASVEQAIRGLSPPPNGKATEIHAWFTIGPREIALRLENEVAKGQRAPASGTSSQVPPPDLIACAEDCALRLTQYRADNWSVSMAWRCVASDHMDDPPLE
jgi:hypothetical protein